MKNHITIKRLIGGLPILSVVACVLLAAGSARGATNLLVNGDMSSEVGWTEHFNGPGIWSGRWAEGGGIPPGGEWKMLTNGIWDMSAVYKLGFGGGVGTNEPVHIYQDFGAAPGALYVLACDAGVQNWWHLWSQIELIFFDSGSNILAISAVVVSTNLHDDFNGTTNLYDVGTAMYRVTNSAYAPLGTTKVRAQLSAIHGTQLPSGGGGSTGGNAFFDNASLTSTVIPPAITAVTPVDGTLLATNTTLSFSASSAAGITNIVVQLNGVDVSGDLVISGPSTSKSVAYTNLQPNTMYNVAITVTDAANISSSQSLDFDTLSPVFLWEAEDYNYSSGTYINNPTPTTSPNPGVSYFGVTGVDGIDFHDYSANGPQAYRASDAMSTGLASSEYVRSKFVAAGASDHNVGWFDGQTFDGVNVGIDTFDPGEWVNYTRNFPAGTYNIYARLAVGHSWARFSVSQVTSDETLGNQTTAALGVFEFAPQGWGNYVYVPLTDALGNLVKFSPSAKNTLRMTAASGGDMNFFMLLPADTNRVAITDVYPDGSTVLQGTNKLTFKVSSASHSIPQSNVVVTLNGVTNSLTFTGSPSSWNVSAPLALNVTNYVMVISVTDNAGHSHSVTRYFDTFNPASYVIEAEDYDFGGGGFIDNPVITSNAAANSYFDKLGTDNVDFSVGDATPPLTAPFRYRQLDTPSTDVCSDTRTRALVAAQLTNGLAFSYNLAYWATNAWMNYSRTYPAGSFNVYARLAGEGTGVVQLDKVSGSATNYLGTFSLTGRGYDFFDWIPLVDTNTSQAVAVTLGGVATLRTTTLSGNANPNSYLLVPVVTTPDVLKYSYSAGVLTLSWDNAAFRLQSQTNNPGAGISAGWSDYPGGAASPVNVTVDRSKGSIFFRLAD